MSRYVLLTEFFPPHHGGIEDTLGRMAGALGSEVTVVAPAQEGDDQIDRAVKYNVIRRSIFSGKFRPRWMWLIPWLWKQRGGIDLLMFGHYSPAVTAGLKLSYFGLPYAIILHGHDLLSELEKPGRSWLVKLSLRRAEWIGVNSQYMADHVHRLGLPWVKIVKLHPMIDDSLSGQPTVARTGHNLITVCRLVPRKNIGAVIAALAELKKDIPDIRYNIVGDGPERVRLEALTKQLGVGDRVIFHGRVDEATKWKLLQSSAVGVMAPLAEGSDIEGFGLFFLEASAAGLPVVASNSGGAPDAVQDNVTGRVVPVNDQNALTAALRDILYHPAIALQYGQAGQNYVRQEFLSSVRLQRFQRLLCREQQDKPPLVSVVIPSYQSANTIIGTIDDVLAQTWPNLEIIVVDDGSTDNLAEAIKKYSEKVIYIRQENMGAAAARNTGAANAKGEYYIFADADLSIKPGMISSMVVALETHPEIAFVYSDFVFGPKPFHLFEFSVEKLRQRNYIHTTSLIRREDFPGFDASLKKFQDWDLWLTMCEQGKKGMWIPRTLFSVQQRAGGISTWLPSFVYKLPLIGQGKGSATIAKYRQAERIIQDKHHLGGVAK